MRPDFVDEDGTRIKALNRKIGTPEVGEGWVGGGQTRQPIPVESIELKDVKIYL